MLRFRWIFLLVVFFAGGIEALDDRLAGNWKTLLEDEASRLVVEMTLGDDGSFSYSAVGVLKEGFLDSDADEEENPFANYLSGDLPIRVAGQGTWDTDGDQIIGNTSDSEIRLDGKAVDVFLDELYRAAAEDLADEFGVAADEREGFINLVVLGAQENFAEQDLEEGIFGQVLEGTYVLGEDILTITDAEGDPLVWTRANASSAVAPVSWGWVKGQHGSKQGW